MEEQNAFCAKAKCKKIIKIVAIILALTALLVLFESFWRKEASGDVWRSPMYQNGGYAGRMMDGEYAGEYGMMGRGYDYVQDSYVFPYDAMQTGKLALRVDDLDTATQNIKNAANLQGGEVVYYETNSATSFVRSGIVVVKVTGDKFDTVFAELKKQGLQVVQESVTKGQDTGDAYIKVVYVADEQNVDAIKYYTKEIGKWILVIVAIKILVTLAFTAFIIILLVQFFRHTLFHHHRVRGHNVEEKKKSETKPLRRTRVAVVKRKTASRSRK